MTHLIMAGLLCCRRLKQTTAKNVLISNFISSQQIESNLKIASRHNYIIALFAMLTMHFNFIFISDLIGYKKKNNLICSNFKNYIII